MGMIEMIETSIFLAAIVPRSLIPVPLGHGTVDGAHDDVSEPTEQTALAPMRRKVASCGLVWERPDRASFGAGVLLGLGGRRTGCWGSAGEPRQRLSGREWTTATWRPASTAEWTDNRMDLQIPSRSADSKGGRTYPVVLGASPPDFRFPSTTAVTASNTTAPNDLLMLWGAVGKPGVGFTLGAGPTGVAQTA